MHLFASATTTSHSGNLPKFGQSARKAAGTRDALKTAHRTI
jgi:hypothetical protein